MMVPVRSEVFDWVQLGCIGRQEPKWMVFLRALFALPMDPAEFATDVPNPSV